MREQEAELGSAVQKSVGANAVIRFDLADAQVADYRRQLATLHGHSFRFILLSYLVERTPNVAFLVLQMAILAFGSVMAFGGRLEIGSLLAFNTIVLSLSVAITGLTRIMPLLLEASGGIRRISQLLDETAAVRNDPTAAEVLTFARSIDFRDVRFPSERCGQSAVITLKAARRFVHLAGGNENRSRL